eukprot:TRINITY_DN7631_c0_g1_i4.p1 TRINITY_DN7631_c0_g1~~TRINITY_DN7631_c0_g1_i4.p1  ORF type:complete len:673 (-),score=100.14 TRINITY_DN7631_c0_g1_i4:195-2213(-)
MRCARCYSKPTSLDEELLETVLFFSAGQGCFSFPVCFKDAALENAYVADTLRETTDTAFKQSWIFIALLVMRSIILLSELAQPVQRHHLVILLWIFLPLAVWAVILLSLILLPCRAPRITEQMALAMAMCTIFVALFGSYRGAILLGVELELKLLYPLAEESLVLSDSSARIAVVMVLMAFYGLPLRCSRGFFLVLAVPVFDLASIVALPAGNLRGSMPDCTWMMIQLLLVAFHLFSGQVGSEKRLRLEFLRRERSHGKTETCDAGCSTEESEAALSEAGVEQSQTEISGGIDVSDAIFAEGLAAGSIELQLQALKAVGSNEHWLIASQHLRLPAKAGHALHGDAPDSAVDSGLLGKGAFGAVSKGYFLHADVAIKLSLPRAARLEFTTLPSELRVLRRLRHPNIVAFYGACVLDDINKLALVEEFVSGRSLTHKLRNEAGLDATGRHSIACGICAALLYLHVQSPPVVHGDLKPDNVLLEDISLKPKLIDFGFSRLETASNRVPGSSPAWAAPEILKQSVRHPTCAADMFSFGRLLYTVMTGCRSIPPGAKREELIALAEKGSHHLTWPNTEMKERYHATCLKCLCAMPERRASAETALGMLRRRAPLSRSVLQIRAAGRRHLKPGSDDSDESRTSTLEDAYNSDAGSHKSSSRCKASKPLPSVKTRMTSL